jgi:hypothetical protein
MAMPLWVPTENPDREMRRWLRRWTDQSFVDQQLAVRHPSLSSSQTRKRAREIALHVTQGLEYIDSAEPATVLTRPLPLFYAVENLTKALVMMETGTIGATDFRVHGLTSDKQRRYSIKNLRCKVGSAGRDVWSRVVQATSTELVAVRFVHDGHPVVGDADQSRMPTAGGPGRMLQFGELIKRMPELQQDVIAARWGCPYTVRIEIYSLAINSGPPTSQSVRVRLDYMHDADTKAMIARAERSALKGYQQVFDVLNSVEYAHPGPSAEAPPIRADAFGDLYADFGPLRSHLSDVALHFAALFILSDVVRYQPDRWKRLLDEHPIEATLVDRYLDVAVRKVPNLVLTAMLRQCVLFCARPS